MVIGAGDDTFWCRCIVLLAQVWKKGGDLRRKMGLDAFGWRRSPREKHTCAKNAWGLRREVLLPAPTRGNPKFAARVNVP